MLQPEILLFEDSSETGTLDGRIVDNQRLYLLMMQQIAVAWTDVGVGQVFVDLQWFSFPPPFAILPIESLLGDLADIGFRIEIGGECLMVVAGITVNDVGIFNRIEIILGSIIRIDTGYTWVESRIPE